ncbi:ABC transporter permease subunit, partial [Campylobacter coli]
MENVFNAQNIEFLMQGLVLTLKIALATCIISIIFGTFLAITKNYGDRFSRLLATCYIDIFRNTPLLLWMLAACFVLPSFFPQMPQAFWGTIGFSLYTSS